MIPIPKQKYLWIIERKIGHWAAWVAKGKKGPHPDELGFFDFKLGKAEGQYAVDPNKLRSFRIPKGIKAGDTVKLQLWKEDETTPLDFFASEKKIGADITATMLGRLSRIKRLDLITMDKQGLEPMLIILILSVIGNIIAIGYLASKLVGK